MTDAFDHGSFAWDVPAHYLEAFTTIWDHLAIPGTWLDSPTRIQVACETRSTSPPAPTAVLDDLTHEELLADTVRRIAQEPAKLHREWFDTVTKRIGLGPYAEAAAIVAQVIPIDRFCELLGRGPVSFPAAGIGTPPRIAPDGLTDRGAWLPMLDMPGANVAAALSYVPIDNMLRLGLVRAMYSGTNFADLRWDDRVLSRPQIELLAARTSSHNQCFY